MEKIKRKWILNSECKAFPDHFSGEPGQTGRVALLETQGTDDLQRDMVKLFLDKTTIPIRLQDAAQRCHRASRKLDSKPMIKISIINMVNKMPDPKFWMIPVLLAGIILPQAALAYVGPGAGLSAIGTLIALIGAVVLLIVGFVWYPVKRFLKKSKTPDQPRDERPEQ
ncbi:hypothetical protein [Sulfitobacter sp. MF3-043]|uniref:hypothetical protein n=1 Tax=Sulfitobacter sediminivivens TaxID=3252902 RepID=UPI0036DCA8E7